MSPQEPALKGFYKVKFKNIKLRQALSLYVY